MLVDRAVGNLLAAFSSSDPTPGGGSASALASAVGASLLLMVAGLPKTRDGSNADRAALAASAAALEPVRADLAAAIDADADAYDQVVTAYKLPKGTADEERGRARAVQRALEAATETPLALMRRSVRALEEAAIVAAHGYKAAASDVGVAIALLTAGAAGAKLNVDANLSSVADSVYRERVSIEVNDLLRKAHALGQSANALLR